jgi:hypothetical protein
MLAASKVTAVPSTSLLGGAVAGTSGDAEAVRSTGAAGAPSDALGSAAGLAGLEQGGYEVEFLEPKLTLLDQLLFDLTARVWSKLGPVVRGPTLPATVTQWIEAAMEPIAFAERWNDPRGVYAYCFCDVR